MTEQRASGVSMWPSVALGVASIVLMLLLGEAAIRIVHPSVSLWRYPNYIALAARDDPDQPKELLQYSRTLGYEPKPDASGIVMHQPISYSADGVRNQNSGLTLLSGRPVLAVGDSYTEGFAVKDDESWPARLERILRRRVLNGGVRGYGLDQIVLRAEQLQRRFDPDTVILAFIADDVRRVMFSAIGSMHKPYFAVGGGELELKNVPVPATPVVGAEALPRRILGYSYLLDFVMRRLGVYTLWYGSQRVTGQDGSTVACMLMKRFADGVGQAKVLVVAQPQYDVWSDPKTAAANQQLTSGVLSCARAAGLQTLDLHDAFARAGASRNPDALYFDWHFNAAGNELAAKAIAKALQ